MRRAVDSAKLATEHARLGRAVALATLILLAGAVAVAAARGGARHASTAGAPGAVRRRGGRAAS
jgi:hypothetical protein